MTEKLRTWFPYDVDIVRKGCRKPERRTTRAPIDLEVASLSSADLPIVGRVVQGPIERNLLLSSGQTVELHGFDGSLWLPAARGTADGISRDVRPSFWNETITRRPGNLQIPQRADQFFSDPMLEHFRRVTGRWISGWEKVEGPETLEGTVAVDNLTECLNIAQACAADLILVDGETIWRRVLEPFWQVYLHGDGAAGIHLDVPQSLSERTNPRTTGFRLDRLEAARSFCGEHGRSRSKGEPAIAVRGEVLEFDWSYIKRDDPVVELLHLAGWFVSSCGERVASMTDAGLAHYVSARETLPIMRAGAADPEHVVSFVDALDGMAADLRRFDYPRDGISSRDEMLKRLDLIDWRIRRFEAPALGLAETPPELETTGPVPT